jgi:hypothetical protein
MADLVVAVPVGPTRIDAVRGADLLDALMAYEPAARVVLIDDAHRADRDLDALAERHPGVTLVRNPRDGRGPPTLGGLCVATVTALAWTRENAPGAWCLRLDTDALVIAPFARSVEAALGPGVGVAGSCDWTCNGDQRTWPGWARAVSQHARPVWLHRRPPRPGRHAQQALVGRNAKVRREIRAALAGGYAPGRHCLGAGYAVSAELIAAMADAGMLEDPLRWRDTLIGDDVMIAVRAAGLGLELRDLNEVFGLYHVGLPDSPQRLAERGFAIVHSVRNDARFDEESIRAWFRVRRR